ncbi:hypothetical protein E2C01_093447 [Portunus trituberculatus]|uniref:Uncharacterized protein n=1 Tax=Portunus trituberculatus TaxID=210409 RepID=A0A5B7JU15_PORTR|nr:hypothetical protein [Portunus trituberculatus]
MPHEDQRPSPSPQHRINVTPSCRHLTVL